MRFNHEHAYIYAYIETIIKKTTNMHLANLYIQTHVHYYMNMFGHILTFLR